MDEMFRAQLEQFRSSLVLEMERREQLQTRVAKIEIVLDELEKTISDLTVNVRVLEARVAVYAGVGAMVGGVIVALIEVFVARRF